MSYRLTYPILVSVENMIDADGVGLTARDAADALRSLAAQIEANPVLLSQTFRRPVDSTLEDRWVMRSVAHPNRIITPKDGMILGDFQVVRPRDIAKEHTLDSISILERQVIPERGRIWSRPEDISSNPVLLTLSRDMYGRIGNLDLSDWMAWAEEGEIIDAVLQDWDFSRVAADAMGDEWHLEQENPLALDVNLRLAYRICDGEEEVRARVIEEDRARALSYLNELRPGFDARLAEAQARLDVDMTP